jgi:heterodisulfide reductase subunit B
MSYLLYAGCKVPYHLPQYGQSARAVLKALGVPFAEAELGCCGYPMRHLYPASHLASAARVLSLARRRGQSVVCLCKCCFGNLKQAALRLEEEPELAARAAEALAAEGLEWAGGAPVEHLTTVLDRHLDAEAVRRKVVRPLSGLKAAALYGCHALRPSEVTGYDNPWNPSLLERLLEAAGARPVEWEGRLECCGNPIRRTNPELSRAMMSARLAQAAEAGAEVLCLSCTHSAMQAAWVWEQAGEAQRAALPPVALYPQLLGLALGLEPSRLGLEQNRPPGAGLWERVLEAARRAGAGAA